MMIAEKGAAMLAEDLSSGQPQGMVH